jgi:hypothetical protein
MNTNKKENEIQIELTEDIAQGTYANLAVIAHSSSEFVLDFIRILPGTPKAKVQSRIILTPENAKRLAFALQENLIRFENAFGPIGINQKIGFAPDIELTDIKGEA